MSIDVYFLKLNDMRGSFWNTRVIAASFSPDKLIEYAEREIVEPYTDGPSEDDYGNSHTYRKVFRKGSDLEWCNPPMPEHGQGIVCETVKFATEKDIPEIVRQIVNSDVLFLS